MTTDQAMAKVVETALQYGYTPKQIQAFSWEVREKIQLMEDVDTDTIDELIEELF